MIIQQTPNFKSDVKRMIKKNKNAIELLEEAINAIISNDQVYLRSHRDHSLQGNLKGTRELHIKKDWLLHYMIKSNELTLILISTGSHNLVLNKRRNYKLSNTSPYGGNYRRK